MLLVLHESQMNIKDEYPTLMDALAEPTDDTLAVIGIFFKVTNWSGVREAAKNNGLLFSGPATKALPPPPPS